MRSLPGLTLAALASLVAPASAGPRGSAQTRADQVVYADLKGQSRLSRGVVKENSLARVIVAEKDRDRTIPPLNVLGVSFGDVPSSFSQAQAYLERGDFENAAAKFAAASADGSARDVVRAAARLAAARAWMQRGAQDPQAFRQALSESERFLTDYPNQRDVPAARELQGRAAWLAGDAARAADLLHALFQDGRTKSEGYPVELVHRAGLAAADAYLAAGDVAKARETYDAVDSSLAEALAAVGAGTTQASRLSVLEALARQGEGRCLLASGGAAQARTFFQRERDGAKSDAQRFAAQLGLGEALLAEGHAREAELELAQVSALDSEDRDRVARALVGLAECALKLPESTARQEARRYVQIVRDDYGDTPSAARAKTLSESL
jgi:tetratricopeptide (TPR) repeat protein